MDRVDGAPVRRLWIAVLCGYLALGATLQELPPYAVGRFGLNQAATGLLVGAAFGATALTRPFAGRVGDAGRAKPVVVAGGVITALAATGHLLAQNPVTLLLARLLMGVGEGTLFSGGLPWVLAGTPAGRRGRIAGWFGLSMWGGLTGGPLLAVALHHVGGPTAVWLAVIALPTVSALVVSTTRRQPTPDTPTPVVPRSFRDVLPVGAGVPGLCIGLAAYGYGSLTALLVLYLTRDHLGGQNLGLATFAVAFLLTRGVGSPMVDRFGGLAVARIVLLIEFTGLVVLATAGNEPVALLGATLTGVGIGTIYPATAALTLHRTGALRPGVAVGAMTSLWDLGVLAAGPIGGVITVRFGYPTAFATAAGVTLLAVAVILPLRGSVPPTPAIPGAGRTRPARPG